MSVKNCSKCGVSFACLNEERGCWCENYSLTGDKLRELKEDFENCLCENCLKEYGKPNNPKISVAG